MVSCDHSKSLLMVETCCRNSLTSAESSALIPLVAGSVRAAPLLAASEWAVEGFHVLAVSRFDVSALAAMLEAGAALCAASGDCGPITPGWFAG